MLNINKTVEENRTIVALEGRLDTITAPELEKEIETIKDELKELVFDLKDLDYISSAGLRVLLAAQKIMNKQGVMKVTSVNETVAEILEVTGFTDILTIE